MEIRTLYNAREALLIALREHSKLVTASDTATHTDRGVQCQPEFLPMSVEADEEHHIAFAEDRRPGNVPSNEPPLVCPYTFEELLHVVSNVRQGRVDVLWDHQVQAARSYVAADQSEDSEGFMFPSIPTAILSMLPRQHSTLVAFQKL